MSHCDPTTLALAALGEDLDAEDAAHLESCEKCLTEAAELVEVVTLAREAPAELPEVPERVWSGVRSELGLDRAPDGSDTRSGPEPPPVPESSPAPEPPVSRASDDDGPAAAGTVVPLAPRRRGLWAVAGIAAAVGALVGGAVVWAAVDRDGDGTPDSSSAPSVVAQASLDPLVDDVAHAGEAQVLDSPDGEVIRVDATALPQRDGFYEVWLIDPEVTKLVALGALPAGSIGTFTVPPGVSIADFPIVDISLEPLDGDPAHSRNSLMRGTLET